MIAWFVDNREWVFGGVGVAAVSGVIGLLWQLTKRSNNGVSQKQTSGAASTNIQAGRDINVKKDATPHDGR